MASKIYALYRGEINLMDGTLAEIARRKNVKISTLRYMLSQTYKRRKANAKGAYLELVEIIDAE